MRTLDVMPGDRLDEVLVKMVNLARAQNEAITAVFNETTLIANPGDNAAQVGRPYTLKLEAWKVESERKEALERKLREEKLQAAIAGGLVLEKRPPKGFVFLEGGKWSGSLRLISPGQLHTLPHGTVLKSIQGDEKVVGIDDIDEDTRGGFVAWGFEL